VSRDRRNEPFDQWSRKTRRRVRGLAFGELDRVSEKSISGFRSTALLRMLRVIATARSAVATARQRRSPLYGSCSIICENRGLRAAEQALPGPHPQIVKEQLAGVLPVHADFSSVHPRDSRQDSMFRSRAGNTLIAAPGSVFTARHTRPGWLPLVRTSSTLRHSGHLARAVVLMPCRSTGVRLTHRVAATKGSRGQMRQPARF